MYGRHRFHANPLLRAALMGAVLALGVGASAVSPPTTFVAEGAADRDLFGVALDVSGDSIAIAASATDLERDDVGVVYLFEASADGVESVATLAAGDAELGDRFGTSVGLGGDAVVVGAPGVILSELNEGAAYLFERDGETWTEVAKVHREVFAKNDMFGSAVAMGGGVAVVGAPGADVAGTDSGTAVVYERLEGTWERVATLASEDAAAGARFGTALAVDGERILVGAVGDTLAGEDAGSAYLFERGGDGWHQVARLAAAGGKGGDGFGNAVALADDVALVGARFADLTGSDEGAAYLFERTGEGWTEVAAFTAPEPADRDQFGRSVALAGDVALVGAPRVDVPVRDAGGVWTFARGADGWATTGRLSPAAPEMYDEFGSNVAADGSLVVVGTPQDIPVGTTDDAVTGTATLFRDVR